MHGSAQAKARTGSLQASAAVISSLIRCKSGSICQSDPYRGVFMIRSPWISPPRIRPALQRVPPKSMTITPMLVKSVEIMVCCDGSVRHRPVSG
jgi:hypothetical protein